MAKKKEKKKADPEEIKYRALYVVVALIVIAAFVFGVKLIKSASVLGVVVMLAGLAGASILYFINMKRFRVYERLRERNEKNLTKEGEKLDEDMVKTRDRIAALDARADEKGGAPQE
ncbi:MAG: hypothetical protein J5819_10575 [Eubacterium sp.]|nr:hypothetical protein [Eubacterium sp.]